MLQRKTISLVFSPTSALYVGYARRMGVPGDDARTVPQIAAATTATAADSELISRIVFLIAMIPPDYQTNNIAPDRTSFADKTPSCATTTTLTLLSPVFCARHAIVGAAPVYVAKG